MPRQDPLAPGETIDRYTVERLCGQGGMGEVYAALDTRLRRRVALKIVRANDARPDAVARIFREARAAAALSHPNTVAIHDLLEHGDDVTIVMELVSGKPLREYIGDAKVPVVRRVEWLVAIARALAAAHRAGIIHRDVKPSNVMISDDGVVKVLDFGLARPADPMSFKTQRGYLLGTPKYMSPEQVEGHDADARSDQYACGVLAFELLTGQHPGLPGEARQPLVGIATAIATVVERMLEPVREARFETMDDVATILEDRLRSADHAPSTAPDFAAPTVAPDTEPAAAPASFAERRAVMQRAAPVMRTLASKEAPSALQRLRSGPPPQVMEHHFDATMKSNEQADAARRAVVEEFDRRKARGRNDVVPPGILATHPSAGVGVGKAVPPPSMPIEVPKRSVVTPAVVIIAVVIMTGIASAMLLAKRHSVTTAHAAEPLGVDTSAPLVQTAAVPPPPSVTPATPDSVPLLPAAKPIAPRPKPKPTATATSTSTEPKPPAPWSPGYASPNYLRE